VTIDDFVFDPKSGAEQATYNLASGALRFVSGAIKDDTPKIATPTAVVAMRGTNLKISVLAKGNTLIAVHRGRVDVSAFYGMPDLADVGLSDLGFAEEGANEIEAAVEQDQSEDSDSDSGDSGDNDSDSDSGDSGGNDSRGGDHDSGGGGND
jgi:uncharacterized membrane protein YgcG